MPAVCRHRTQRATRKRHAAKGSAEGRRQLEREARGGGAGRHGQGDGFLGRNLTELRFPSGFDREAEPRFVVDHSFDLDSHMAN